MTETGKKLRYDEGCLAAHALNLIGDRWALLVVRELMFSPKRFQMIRAGMPGITAAVLTGRLAQLQEVGVVTHDARLGLYALTGTGAGLLPVLESLCRWALIAPGHDPRRFISPSALMISMGVTLQADRAAGVMARAGFDLGAEQFEMTVADGRVTTVAAQPDAPFVLSSDGNRMAAAVYGSVPIAVMAAKGIVGVSGDPAAAQDFVDLFRLAPQP